MTFQFDSLSAFFVMGGHGAYVWGSYLVTSLALSLLVVYPYIKKKQLRIQIAHQECVNKQEKILRIIE